MTDTKNAAPERIELPGGWKFARYENIAGKGFYEILNERGVSISVGWSLEQAQSFAAAMQPVPSESDEFVLSDEDETLLMAAAENLRSADDTEKRVDAAFRIAFKLDEYRRRMAARHRQKPADIKNIKILSFTEHWIRGVDDLPSPADGAEADVKAGSQVAY